MLSPVPTPSEICGLPHLCPGGRKPEAPLPASLGLLDAAGGPRYRNVYVIYLLCKQIVMHEMSNTTHEAKWSISSGRLDKGESLIKGCQTRQH